MIYTVFSVITLLLTGHSEEINRQYKVVNNFISNKHLNSCKIQGKQNLFCLEYFQSIILKL